MNLIEFLKCAKIEDLELPPQIIRKLRNQKMTDFQRIYASIQMYRAIRKSTIEGFSDEEMQVLDQKCVELFVAHGLMKAPNSTPRKAFRETSSAKSKLNQDVTSSVPRQTSTVPDPGLEKHRMANGASSQEETRNNKPKDTQVTPSPLVAWEDRLAPQLRKVELIGEIPVSKEDLDEISMHLSRIFYRQNADEVLNYIGHNYPATFLAFMVGQGIFGYGENGFWPAYAQALHHPVDSIAFGRMFEKLLARFGKPLFRELQERSLRYVSLVLAHGGIPVYCLKDFFTNIVLNSILRPQLFALEGEELIDEILKHPAYTFSTDKPVLHFLEYGGSTATNLLERARRMLLSWQQNQIQLSAEEAGLPPHITQFFAEWTVANTSLITERGSRNRLKRPQLSLDPWGLGIFIKLPSQPVSACDINDLLWKLDTGETHEEIKARTQRKGDQVETREITLRLSHVVDQLKVQFSQGGNDYEWNLSAFSEDHLLLAFDPTSGVNQNHVLARENWLLFPNYFTISILSGEGSLLEVLPDLPGEWSKFRLECWDLSQTDRLGLMQHDRVIREIEVRTQEKFEPPSLEGGNIVPTDLEEYPFPFYMGKPPSLRIPLPSTDDIRTELTRWLIRIDNVGFADPELTRQETLADLSELECTITGQTALVHLSSVKLLTEKPAGTYQVSIKGPLGRDASFSFQILPEFTVSGLKELYIPDRNEGPEAVKFTVQTSLLAGVEGVNGAAGIIIESVRPGLHQISVPQGIGVVGLLVRRETVHHQYIQVPVYIRLKRLRWRIVTGSGIAENWLQKFINLSIQDLLQQESPLMIVDLPGNIGGNLSLSLNLVDIQGQVIQILKPADRSTKRTIRFWRFDLSKIKHSLEMNDGPILRLDLVGFRTDDQENEFQLPILVLSREIQIMQLQTEVYSSPDKHHILVTWEEKKQLRSRALIMWSLFRPWLPPKVENIPDATIGEYEFSISRKDYADGVYRMQMVVVDPWAPSPPPLLPPNADQAACHDMELTPPADRLKKLEKEIGSATYRQTTQFSNRIEISLIRQYLGEIAVGNHDLEVCCRNLQPATSREILTLKSLISHMGLHHLDKVFGEQIILPVVIDRLYQDMLLGEISLAELISVIKLAPHSNYWSTSACEVLVQIDDPKIRFRALVQLVDKNIARAVECIVKLLIQSALSIEDAVALLFEVKFSAIEQLRNFKSDPFAKQLIDMLGKYNPLTGLPIVRPGSWVLTNAGWGRIDTILDPRTRISLDSFMEGEGKFILSVTMHIYESYDLSGEKAVIDMFTNLISFPRVKQLFVCPQCGNFVTSSREIFKSHQISSHGEVILLPGEKNKDIQLTSIQFNTTPNQSKKDQ